MPCSGCKSVDPSVATIAGLKDEIKRERHLIDMYRSAFCAVMNDLQRSDLIGDVITRATITGKIDVGKVWAHHKDYDAKRLNKMLKDLSSDEIDMIRTMMTEIK